jgi:hypothetical protein
MHYRYHGGNVTGGKFATGVHDTGGHIFPEIFIGTGGKFATGWIRFRNSDSRIRRSGSRTLIKRKFGHS